MAAGLNQRGAHRWLATTMCIADQFHIPAGTRYDYNIPAQYQFSRAPVPWIFRGDVNKPLFVLLAMEAPMVALAIILGMLS